MTDTRLNSAEIDSCSFGPSTEPVIDICVPTFRDDPSRLIRDLSKLDQAADCRLTIYDDGSGDTNLTERVRSALSAYPGPSRLMTASQNMGRSAGRNALIEAATADWILLIDADMAPDAASFLSGYIETTAAAEGPELVCGGFSLAQAKSNRATALHAAQSRTSEVVDAKIRTENPGRYVFTSNILAHREILETIAFDDGFVGWGWEDVDWGLRVAERFPVRHIDNTATHLGLDADAVLLSKYSRSAGNFARLAARHPGVMHQTPLYKMARMISGLPGRGLIRSAAKALALSAPGFTPIRARLFGLKLYRAAVYAETIQ